MTAGRSQKESWNCIPGLFLYLYVEVIIMTTIQYADVNQQIEKLKSRNLTNERGKHRPGQPDYNCK